MKGKVLIKAVYSWYNVYIDNHLILTKIKDVSEIIKALHAAHTSYDLKI